MSPAPASKTSLPSTKGEETRAAILTAAVEQASAGGFESLTIGTLAERTGMSKSGLFAHFGSKLDLQIATLDEASRLFTEGVMMPAMKAPRGLKRLRAIFDGWIDWPQRASLPGGCPIDAATREYHHQPGPMRDAVIERQRVLGREIGKAVLMAVETGELKAGTDPGQFTFEMFGIILGCYRTELLLGIDESNRRARAAFERLVEHNRT
ncbi:MAG TPA: TetR/AcrR family transcriptional regulator [Usitatibacter sp.]|nr:TetR/AcrR family transcriptional regulator [Usitatibacter sp.]